MTRRFCSIVLIFLSPIFLKAQDLRESLNLNLDNGLIQSTVTYLEEDELGRMWIATPNGLNYYNGFEVGKIEGLEQYCLGLKSIDSNLFCVGTKGVYRINIYSLQIENYNFEESEYYDYAFLENGIAIKNSNTSDSLFLDFELKLKNWPSKQSRIGFNPSNQSFISAGINLLSNTKGVFAIQGNDTNCLYPSYGGRLISYSKNRVFAATHNGLLEVYMKGKNLKWRVHFPKYRIESILKDSEENLWIATSEQGVLMLHRNLLISNYKEIKDDENDAVSCWTFQKWKSKLYVNTNDGIKRIGGNNEDDQLEKISEGLSIISSYACSEGLFLGSLNSGVFFYDGQKIRPIYSSEENNLNNTIVKFFPFKNYLIGTTKLAMLFFDFKGNFLFQKPFPFEEPKTYLMNIRPYESGFLASTTKGIYFLDSNLISLNHPQEFRSVISMTAGENKVWLAGLGDGLLVLENGKIKAEEIGDKYFHSIHRQKKDELWMSSSTAVYKRTGDLNQKFAFNNGFPIKEYNQGGFYSDSLLYYSGVGGVFVFDPEKVRLSAKKPQILFQHRNMVLNLADPLELDYDQSEILLKYEIIDLIDPQNVENRFEFGGRALNPNEIGTLQLSPSYGEEELIVYFKNKANGKEFHYILLINRNFPFWKKWWFVVLAFMAALLSLLGIFSLWKFYKTKKLLQAQREENRLGQERLRISQELHDNIGARISHIISSLDMEMYQRQAGDKVKSLENINVFARETMSQLRETIWMVSDKSIFYSELLVRIEQYVEQINSLTKVEIHFTQEDIFDFELGPIQTINYYRIVQEGINNALKYAKAEKINIRASGKGNPKLKICISDTGIGFDPKTTRKGTGIKGMEKRAEETKARFSLKSGPNGTELILVLD